MFLVSGFLFCVVQSGMEASSQCLFPEAGGVEGEGIEYPKGEGPHSFPLFVLRGGSTVPVSWDAAGPHEMKDVKVSLPQAVA